MGTSGLVGGVVAVLVLLACSLLGLVRRRRDGRMTPVSNPPPAGDGPGTREPTSHAEVLAGLGFDGGTPVTLVQFSSAFCAPCRATRALCASVAATVPGVRHLDVDAESHLDAVRALDVRRTPTLLVVDADGRIVRRASGQPPTRAHLLAVIDETMAAAR